MGVRVTTQRMGFNSSHTVPGCPLFYYQSFPTTSNEDEGKFVNFLSNPILWIERDSRVQTLPGHPALNRRTWEAGNQTGAWV